MPPTHLYEALEAPQPPQLLGSELSLTQRAPQRVSPAPVHWQAPPVHCVPDGHDVGAAAVLQAPQL